MFWESNHYMFAEHIVLAFHRVHCVNSFEPLRPACIAWIVLNEWTWIWAVCIYFLNLFLYYLQNWAKITFLPIQNIYGWDKWDHIPDKGNAGKAWTGTMLTKHNRCSEKSIIITTAIITVIVDIKNVSFYFVPFLTPSKEIFLQTLIDNSLFFWQIICIMHVEFSTTKYMYFVIH